MRRSGNVDVKDQEENIMRMRTVLFIPKDQIRSVTCRDLQLCCDDEHCQHESRVSMCRVEKYFVQVGKRRLCTGANYARLSVPAEEVLSSLRHYRLLLLCFHFGEE